MSIFTINGVTYDTADLDGYGYNESTTTGSGEEHPRFVSILLDAIADAARARQTTSATSKDAGLTGSQSWVLAADVSFAVGSSVRVARTSDPLNTYYDGVVTSYVPGTKTLTLDVAAALGTATGVTDWTVSVSGRIGPVGPAGNRNRMINGSMDIDQRREGAALTLTGSVQYAMDRWHALSAGASMSVQRVATGNLDFPFAAKLARGNGATSTSPLYFGQVIESANCQDMAGQIVTLSFYARKGANFSASGNQLGVKLLSGTGTNEGAVSLSSGSWTGLSLAAINTSVTLNDNRTFYKLTGVIPAGAKELAPRFEWTPAGTAGANDWCEVTGVQLEIGSVPTAFERRARATELMLCERHFEKSFAAGTAPAQNLGVVEGSFIAPQVVGASTSQQLGNQSFSTRKFANPTVTLYNPEAANAQVRNVSAGTNCSSTTVVDSDTGFHVSATTAAGSSAGQALAVHWTAEAEI